MQAVGWARVSDDFHRGVEGKFKVGHSLRRRSAGMGLGRGGEPTDNRVDLFGGLPCLTKTTGRGYKTNTRGTLKDLSEVQTARVSTRSLLQPRPSRSARRSTRC